MALYSYRAKNKNDQVSEGQLEAQTTSIARDMLSSQGLTILSLVKKKRGKLSLDITLGGVSAKDKVIFSRQLSVLISAKMPVVEALHNVVKQTTNQKLQSVLSAVADEVEGGSKLSNALDQHPKVFSGFFVNIIRSGESSGRLDEVLNYLADQLEQDYELNSKIKGALIYPAFILSFLFILGIVMMVFVVPRLTEMLTQTGAELPLSTQILISISESLRNFWWLIIAALVGLVFLFRLWLQTTPGRRSFDRAILSLPIFGKLFRYIYVVRLSRSLKTLMIGGVDLLVALDIASRVPGNESYRQLILDTKAAVEDGNSIATAMSKSKIIPQMVPQMLTTGEETGAMTEVLDKLASFYEREVTNIVDNLVALLEPLIMVILGVAVGVMVAAIVLPMYNISANL